MAQTNYLIKSEKGQMKKEVLKSFDELYEELVGSMDSANLEKPTTPTKGSTLSGEVKKKDRKKENA
jgi:hypothetical protein